MKKILSVLLVLALALSVTACKKNEPAPKPSSGPLPTPPLQEAPVDHPEEDKSKIDPFEIEAVECRSPNGPNAAADLLIVDTILTKTAAGNVNIIIAVDQLAFDPQGGKPFGQGGVQIPPRSLWALGEIVRRHVRHPLQRLS